MQTAEKNAKEATVATDKSREIKTENRPSLSAKEAKDEKNANPAAAEAPQAQAAPNAEAKAFPAVAADKQSANVEQPAEGQALKPIEPSAAAKPIKPALNLEQTLKAVDSLHRRSIQRVNLLTRIKQLEAFEVALTQENDELEDNPYQGCKLIIEDDKRRTFVTTTPGLIRLVSQFIFNACHEKLAEIEAQIVFPNA